MWNLKNLSLKLRIKCWLLEARKNRENGKRLTRGYTVTVGIRSSGMALHSSMI
jgi:hypothetical protein